MSVRARSERLKLEVEAAEEPVQRRAHFLLDRLVTRRKLVIEYMQQHEIDLVGAMRVRGVDIGSNIGGVVEQQIEHKVTLVLMRADNPGVHRNMVGDQCVAHHAFLEAKVLW